MGDTANAQAELIQQLLARINQLEANQGNRIAQSGMSVQPVESRRPRPKLPDPEPYDGTKRSLYPQFRSKLRAKLQVDALSIGNDYDRMWYAFSRLSGEAAAQILPWMDKYASDASTLQENALKDMMKQLDFNFLDRNLQEKAVHELATLKQANRSFSTFLAEFNRLLMESGGHDWTNDVKRSYMDRALNREMKDRLVTVDKKEDFEEYCQQLQRFADRMEENQQHSFKPGKRNPSRTSRIATPVLAPPNAPQGSKFEPVVDSMDWEPTVAARGHPRAAKWVSEEEIAARRQQGRCLRCGASTHFIGKCPYAPPRRNPQAARVYEPELEDIPAHHNPRTYNLQAARAQGPELEDRNDKIGGQGQEKD
jgi:hypothetical protein